MPFMDAIGHDAKKGWHHYAKTINAMAQRRNFTKTPTRRQNDDNEHGHSGRIA
ncbi:hypothetical protein DPMN_056853 [Dreissena polymorpha]|uniref:Uncharacterized protein n=1 Tax=Dreissena polymorpha TaxID=45954 RepID=A0A9D4HTL4_DREPO|nr:hypothetical protein DPMN_056853 [Dreissena polymorpha]